MSDRDHTAIVGARVAPDVRQWIEQIAARERRTLSNIAAILLDEALDQRDRRSEALLRVEAARLAPRRA